MFSLVRYIKALHSYLLSFTKRAQPLVDVDTQQKETEAQFSVQWEAGEIEGWEETKVKPAANGEGNGEGIWCSACEYHNYFREYHQPHLRGRSEIVFEADRL